MSHIEAIDGFCYRNQKSPDFMFGWVDGNFLYDKNLLPEETVEQLKAYESPYQNTQTAQKYWQIRNAELTKLKPNWPPFENAVERKLNLSLFTFAVVSGAFVRQNFDSQFIQGGQHNVYEYVPRRWFVAEKALDRREIPLVFMHEALEYFLMFFDKKYQDCHFVADKVEKFLRKILFRQSCQSSPA